MRRVLVIGSATIDVIRQAGAMALKMGGVVTYGGITFRRHGLPTAVLCNIAPQDSSLLEILGRHDIEVASGATPVTTRFINHLLGDHRRQEMPAHAAPITADQLQRFTTKIDHLHLGPLHPQDIEVHLLADCAARRLWVTLDVQGYTRQVTDGQVRTRVAEDLPAALRVASIIKADREELEAITDSLHLTPHELICTYGLREIVVTAGREGGDVLTAAGEEIHYTAPRLRQVADPTGAGDVFFASYLAAHLHEGQNIASSCRRAALVTTRHVQGKYISDNALQLAP